MEEKFYTLSGANHPVEDWVQLLNETSNVFYSKSYQDIIGMTKFPVRYWNQIPQRWLDKDPGFKILLRANIELETLPAWILRPNEYCLKCTNKNESREMLIITHHSNQFLDWEDLKQKFSGFNLSWTCYAVTKLPSWPEECYLNMYDALFHENLVFGSFYDINYWQNDTLGPLHIHLLQNAVTCRNIENLTTYDTFLTETSFGVLYLNKNKTKIK